jgi:hypothetical protein
MQSGNQFSAGQLHTEMYLQNETKSDTKLTNIILSNLHHTEYGSVRRQLDGSDEQHQHVT